MNSSTRKPTTPGEMLRVGFLEELGITQETLAHHIGVTFSTVSKLVNGHSRVTPSIARKLGAAFATTPEFWLNAQMVTDLWKLAQSDEVLPPPFKSVAS